MAPGPFPQGPELSKLRCNIHLFLLAFFLAMAMLAYEILLTRITSVLLTNQYVFLILGLALLGISAGAITDYAQARHCEANPPTLGLWLSWNSGILVLALLLILRTGTAGLFILAASAALPFVASGLVLAKLFRLFPDRTGWLYAADLAGAAAGAMIVPVVLPAFGPTQSILLLAGLLAGCGAVLLLRPFRPVPMSVTVMLLVAVGWLFYANRHDAVLGKIPIGKDPDKDLYRLETVLGIPAQVVESRWSTFGRTDLVRFRDDPSMMSVFIDGAAGANMLRFDGHFEDSSATFWQATRDFGGMAPLRNLNENQKDSVLIIGPGGGRDVLMALEAGFREITAVEINPQMVQIVKDYRAFNGGIYTDFKNVHVIVGEGRNFLRHSGQKYDLITLFMPITKSSRGLNAFALSESYLFTREAFADYHRHLTPEGSLLIMAHSMPEAVKLMTTALDTLREEGMTVEQAMSHLYLLGYDMMPLFGMRETPLSREESEALHAAVHTTSFDSRYSYVPGVEQKLLRPALPTAIDAGVPMMNPLFLDLAEGRLPLRRLERGTGINLVPATDDRPFFFQFGFGSPGVVSTVLGLATAVLAAVFLIPGYRLRALAQAEQKQFTWWTPLFFSAIGIGYIVIELALFQKLVYYLGDPSRALALLLAALLAGNGLGSFISQGCQEKVATLGALLSAVGALLIAVVMPALFSALQNSSSAVQQGAAALILFVEGVPMGLMFPIGLRVVQERLGDSAAPWMWAVNGSASVVGSALAVVAAISAGHTWSLIIGATCYVIAALCVRLAFERRAGDALARGLRSP